MGKALTDLSFEQWIDFVFDHPTVGRQWYWGEDADLWEGPPEATVDFLARLFRNAPTTLAPFSDAQAEQGLWYMACTACSDILQALLDASVTWPARQAAIQSQHTLFQNYFGAKCTPHLSHLDRTDTQTPPHVNPLNIVCYMWFDLFCEDGQPHDPARAAFDSEYLQLLQRVLDIDSIACQESALHGLGHWASDYPEQVHAAIDSFLSRNPDLDEDLKRYAVSAHAGYVE